MERGLPTQTLRLFSGETCVFVPTFVNVLARTIRQIAPSERGNGIYHLPKFGFRLLDLLKGISEGFLRSLAFNCDQCNACCPLYEREIRIRRYPRFG